LSRASAEIMSGLGLMIVLFCVFFYTRNTPFPGPAALPPVLATTFLLWANIERETAVKRLLECRPAVGIGLISYGLYLYHWPLLAFTHYYLGSAPSPLKGAGLIALAFVLAALSYFYIEQPIRSGRVFKRKALFVFSGLGLAAFGIAGLIGLHTRGLPQRFDAAVLRYAMTNDDGGAGLAPEKCAPAALPDLKGVDICKFGASVTAHPDFLLWGDSHAASLQTAAAVDAFHGGVTGWSVTRSGCPSLVGAARADGFADYSCPDIAAGALQLIRQNHIRNVLLVTRWDMYALGWEKGSDETTRAPFISFTTKDGQRLLRKRAFAAAFMETVKELNGLGVNIWVVKQVPPQLVYVSSALARAAYFGRDPETLQRSYAAILRRRRFIDAVMDGAAKEYPLHFIDPADTFCPARKTCLIAVDGQSLYTDNTHLSTFGALWSRHMLDPFFKTLQASRLK
ncbi:MAG: acyltransferase, partial [Alphaproteobacteria bacterium]|nr:acyltransferase [Alphaproteobacteria bacterium]